MKSSAIILAFVLAFLSAKVYSTHNRAGEITYRRVSGFTYEIMVLTFTKQSSPADRPEIEINWGDNTDVDTLLRSEETFLENDIKLNRYFGTHTYPGPGVYKITFEDPNRNQGIVNIPNSVNVPFFVEAVLQINPAQGVNNSPILLNPPIDNACVGQTFIHNPNAYDVDGQDSLAYTLVTPKTEDGQEIMNYSLPDKHPVSSNNKISLDPITGEFKWESPQKQGEYNIAIRIEEWRNGRLIGYIIRDMQITVGPCDNKPPEIGPLKDLCVEAGSKISFDVTATDPDLDEVTLSASGGPFLTKQSPAVFPPKITNKPTVSGKFEWQTQCSHVRKQPFQVVFRAEDDGSPISLVDTRSVLITVVGPAPKNPAAQPTGNDIRLAWDKSQCNEVSCYKIYRRKNKYGYTPDSCETGVPAYTGYEFVGQTGNINDTTFLDNNNGDGLLHGIEYCYMVVACFPDDAESYASVEFCAELKKDVPIITHVSIGETNSSTGLDTVKWSKPTELDTVQYPGPYKYVIHHSPGFLGNNFVAVDSLTNLNDTVYVHNNLNTIDTAHSYRIDLYSEGTGNRVFIGSTHIASSVYLRSSSSDERNILSWEEHVPWINNQYTVYRKDPGALTFDSITTTVEPEFTDAGLVNGQEYCYKIKSIGEYSTDGIIKPIENWSQEVCSTPQDDVPPCPPVLTVSPDCDEMENLLKWNDRQDKCSGDIEHYVIYYTPVLDGTFNPLMTLTRPDSTFLHDNLTSIAGCYGISAIDSIGNEGEISDTICVDNCPRYELPNVFTPDGDAFNSLLLPFPYRFIKDIDLTIFNRWGYQVFHTTDPDVRWDGKNQDSGEPVSDGVYYYILEVNEIRLSGIETRTVTGFLHVLNSDGNRKF